DSEDHNAGDYGIDAIIAAALRAWCVVEDGSAYRHYFFTAILSESLPSPRPIGRVRMMKPRAKTKKMMNSWFAWFSIVDFINSEASATPMVEAMVVFLVKAMSVFPSGTIAARTACGNTIFRNESEKLNPRDRPAAACPKSNMLNAERNDSATEVEVYIIKTTMARRKLLSARNVAGSRLARAMPKF